MMMFDSDAGAKYDLEFKSPNRLGQNYKSGEDMIDMYKELCNGMSSFLHRFFYCLLLHPSLLSLSLLPHFGGLRYLRLPNSIN